MIKKFTFLLTLFFTITTITVFSQGWIQLTSGTSSTLNKVQFIDDSNGYIVGNDQTVLKTTNGGVNFQSLTTGIAGDYYDLYFFDMNTGVVVGSGGLIIRTTDGGNTWNEVSSGVTYTLYSVSFNGNNGIAGGAAQTIITSSDAGQTWNVYQTDFFGGGFYGAHMVSSSTGYLAGENSIFQPMIAKTTDNGSNFSFTPFYLNSNEGELHDVFFVDETNGFGASRVWTGEGAVSKSTDGGNNWNTTLFNNTLNGIMFSSASTGYAVGFNGDILKTDDSGNNWNYQTSGVVVELFDVNFVNNLTGYSVGESGTILKTTSGGEIPVELTSFNAKVVDGKVKLNWTTSTETNNKGFEIEKKNTGKSNQNSEWIKIGYIEGNGTTTEQHNYIFEDNNLESGSYKYRLKQIDFDGSFEYSKEVKIELNNIPVEYSLNQNYPNPFNPNTTIKFSLPEASNVKLVIYNILGKEVKTLINNFKEAGSYDINWDATDNINKEVTSGVYIYKLTTDNFVSSKKMILIR